MRAQCVPGSFSLSNMSGNYIVYIYIHVYINSLHTCMYMYIHVVYASKTLRFHTVSVSFYNEG